jgi:triosephosphate isomerase
MPRIPFIAGNWKLNLAPPEAATTARELRTRVAGLEGLTLAVFPTALAIPAVVEALAGSAIGTGVQEVEVEQNGAFTGANSASMCRAVGCEWALVGHSERRQLYGETNDRCKQRIQAAFAGGLVTIYCVGETLAERKEGRVEEVLFRQLREGLAGFHRDQVATITLAYEPVWAIGTGENATPEQAQAAHAAIRSWLHEGVGLLADQVRILYGGSVKPANAAELMACPDVDGALVGGASLDPEGLARIARAAVA